MKIELLKTFLEVSNTLHFRIAAENLFITQSAVSARIKLLEDELGVLLFDRSQKHLKLTPEGHRLIKHANEMLFVWQKTKQDVGIAQNETLQLVIGTMMSIGDTVLQDWLQKTHRNIDDVSLLINTYNSVELRKNVLNRIVDVAFLFEPPLVEDLIIEKIAILNLHLVSTEETNVHNALHQDSYIMVDYGEAVNAQRIREHRHAPPAKHVMNQPRIALDFILGAGGSAYLPRQMTFEHTQAGRLFVVEDAPVFTRDIHAIYLEKSQKKDIVEQALALFPQAFTT